MSRDKEKNMKTKTKKLSKQDRENFKRAKQSLLAIKEALDRGTYHILKSKDKRTGKHAFVLCVHDTKETVFPVCELFVSDPFKFLFNEPV